MNNTHNKIDNNCRIDTQKIYRYGSQGFDDYGWGCVYRNVQTLLALSDLPVPSIPEMQTQLGIDPTLFGRNLWIEPVDVRQYLPWRVSLALYTKLANAEPHMLRTKTKDFDHTFRDEEETESFLLSRLKENTNILIDDTVYSYILIAITDGTYVYIDPHVQENNVRTMSRKQFYNRPVWMMLG